MWKDKSKHLSYFINVKSSRKTENRTIITLEQIKKYDTDYDG